MPTVLIVDDDEPCREIWRLVLTPLSCTLLEAGDGLAALALIQATPPDLILLDIIMPKLDGWGVLAALQAEPRTRQIPVVILSAHVRRDDEQFQASGARRLLTKPFPLTELRDVVCELLELSPASE